MKTYLLFGSWQIYSKEYYEFKSRYDIDNMYKDLVEKENVYLIDSNMWYKDGFLEYIITFLNEHYYNQEIKYDLVKSIDNRIKIYKLHL